MRFREEMITFNFYCGDSWIFETDQYDIENATEEAIKEFINEEDVHYYFNKTIIVKIDDVVVATIEIPTPRISIKYPNVKSVRNDLY